MPKKKLSDKELVRILDVDTETLARFRKVQKEAMEEAKRMGATSLINLDVGMYDYSMYKSADGKIHKLGSFDSVNPTNLIVFVKK
ncbi:MAG: hypothetical protein V1492_04120 [Candidatus Micrarchaeota archaeon]